MPRIKLKAMPYYEFSLDLNVRISDLNLGAHLGSSQMTDFLQEARMGYLDRLGANESDLGDGKTGIVIGDLAVNFTAEAFRGDLVTVEVHMGEIKEKGLRIFYRIKRQETLIALAETGVVSFSYSKRQPALIPAQFKDRLNSFKTTFQ